MERYSRYERARLRGGGCRRVGRRARGVRQKQSVHGALAVFESCPFLTRDPHADAESYYIRELPGAASPGDRHPYDHAHHDHDGDRDRTNAELELARRNSAVCETAATQVAVLLVGRNPSLRHGAPMRASSGDLGGSGGDPAGAARPPKRR